MYHTLCMYRLPMRLYNATIQRTRTMEEALRIVSMLLDCEHVEARRTALFIHASRLDECSAWTALHCAARVGSLAFM